MTRLDVTELDVLTFGESMVSFRSAGPLRLSATLTAHLAGAESNVAIGLSRLGHASAWAGRVGGDEFGRLVLRELRAEGVDVSHAVQDENLQTGLMFLEQRTADVMRVDYRRAGSAGSALTVEDLRPALDRGPGVLHLTGITPALSDTAAAAAIWAAETCAASGVVVSLDVNHRARLWSRESARGTLSTLARQATIVIASEDELELVSDGDSELAAVSTLLDRGVEQVVVKRGARGASAWTVDGRVDAPAVPVPVVDVIGAGDAFTAGYLSALLDGEPVAERLRRGTVLGAFSVSGRGDWESLPRRDELDLVNHQPGSAIR
jgi:2-dehydro-3-deoxygluconokinase